MYKSHSFKFGDDGERVQYCEHCKRNTLQRYRPSTDSGPLWRCSDCGKICNGSN